MSEEKNVSVFILAYLSFEANPNPELRTCIQEDKENTTKKVGGDVAGGEYLAAYPWVSSHIQQKTKVDKKKKSQFCGALRG